MGKWFCHDKKNVQVLKIETKMTYTSVFWPGKWGMRNKSFIFCSLILSINIYWHLFFKLHCHRKLFYFEVSH